VVGDFNAVREEFERRGVSEHIRREEMEDFDDLISET
jgi:hypothetical protein